MSGTLLHIDSSARYDGSLSRELSARLAEGLASATGASTARRDLADGIDRVDAAWVGSNFTPSDQRDADQRAVLAQSDAMVGELERADIVVLGCPIYNFAPPSTVKAWVDQVCRAGVTFRFGENGPEGLLTGTRAYVVMTSGGTEVDGPIDFATPYLRHVLGFIGITDVTVIAADAVMAKGEAAKADAIESIDAVIAGAAS